MASSSTPLLRRSVTGLFTPFPNPTLLWKAGALLTAVGIINGAFGAHGLKNRVTDPSKLQAWGTASHYAIISGVALLGISLHPRFSFHRFAGPAIALGSTMFSGSIWGLTLDTDKRFRWLGPVTPLGGALMILGYFSMLF